MKRKNSVVGILTIAASCLLFTGCGAVPDTPVTTATEANNQAPVATNEPNKDSAAASEVKAEPDLDTNAAKPQEEFADEGYKGSNSSAKMILLEEKVCLFEAQMTDETPNRQAIRMHLEHVAEDLKTAREAFRGSAVDAGAILDKNVSLAEFELGRACALAGIKFNSLVAAH